MDITQKSLIGYWSAVNLTEADKMIVTSYLEKSVRNQLDSQILSLLAHPLSMYTVHYRESTARSNPSVETIKNGMILPRELSFTQ